MLACFKNDYLDFVDYFVIFKGKTYITRLMKNYSSKKCQRKLFASVGINSACDSCFIVNETCACSESQPTFNGKIIQANFPTEKIKNQRG